MLIKSKRGARCPSFFTLTYGKENENNCDDDYPKPEVISKAGSIVAAVFTAGAERSVVAASHMSHLLSAVSYVP